MLCRNDHSDKPAKVEDRSAHAVLEDLFAETAFAGKRNWSIPALMPNDRPPTDVPEREGFAALMAAVATRRDSNSFARLFDHFAPRVRAYILRLGSDPATADDLVQDVMLNVWRRAHQFDPAKSSVGTWIFTIARNRRIDVLRKENRPEIDPSDPVLVPDEIPMADKLLQSKQSGKMIRAALAGLPVAQSQLLQLAFFEDMSHGDISQKLSLPLGTVKSRIRLAVDKLRARILEFH